MGACWGLQQPLGVRFVRAALPSRARTRQQQGVHLQPPSQRTGRGAMGAFVVSGGRATLAA